MKLSDIKKLHQKKFRVHFGCYLIEGEHLILELCKSLMLNRQNNQNKIKDIVIYLTEDKLQWAQNLSIDFKLIVLNTKQMQDISETKTPQGVIARVPFCDEFRLHTSDTKNLRSVYLYEVQDPGNLGTILRTLAWFGGFKLLMSPNSVDPFNAKVIRASMGAIFHIDIEQEVSFQTLHERFTRFA